MTRQKIMYWMFDHRLTTTVIITIPVGIVVIAIALKTL
jgi:hypothetical protein